jgi:thiol-disulfide isomerase/thioredoxin
MKKNILTTVLLGLTLPLCGLHAQIASKKGITLDELVKEINVLVQKGDEESKAQMEKEAKIMSNSKNELFVLMGSSLYNFMGNKEEVEKVNSIIAKRFPKGIKAREETFEAFIGDEILNSAQLEKKYADWLKEFPKSYFEKLKGTEQDYGFQFLTYYGQAAEKMARRLIKMGEYDKATAYIDDEPNINLTLIAQDLVDANQSKLALPIVARAYEKNKEALEIAKTKEQSLYLPERNYNDAAALYAKILLEIGNIDESVKIAHDLYESGYKLPSNTIALAEGLDKQGKTLDAFLVLHKAMVKSGRTSDNQALFSVIKPLYTKLNQNGDFERYTTSLDNAIKEAAIAKYKSEMIRKEAPDFSLVNMAGETVKLSDLKGKVVVLDFWATWCGPCKVSFPGMQAAVNKYKDDKEVEFLFIDTWQREDNYKEVVGQFIAENNYTFHVLFDEMKDREKSTTTAYGVDGIPHKVVIDKEGFIRFEASGGSADVEKVLTEMETKIELARKG